MSWPNLANPVQSPIGNARLSRMLAMMDKAILFMTRSDYAHENPAIGVVRGPLVVGLWVLLVFVVVTLVWGAWSPIDSAAVAKGEVVLQSNRKTVQHLEGGVIREIMVKDGDSVKASQPLVLLSDTSAIANRDSLQNQLYTAEATEARLIAERDKKDELAFDKDMVDKSAANPELAKAMASQTSLFQSDRAGQKAKLDIINQRIAQATTEIEGLKSQQTSADERVRLLTGEVETAKKLLERQLTTKPHLFELQRGLSEMEGNRGQYEAEMAKTQQNITELQLQLVNQENDFSSKNAQSLQETQAQLAELREKLRTANDIFGRTTISAPVAGIVTGLKFHTLGGVVEPGTPILDIVPQDDPLIIEVHVRPTDINVVHAGLEARVVFPAYKMRTTPKIPGKVVQVSADAFTDPHNAQAPSYYLARVEVDKSFLGKLKKGITLYPGMPADVFIRTGTRSFLDYLFKPLTDGMYRAFREE